MYFITFKKINLSVVLAFILVFFLSACSHTNGSGKQGVSGSSSKDPMEKLNRSLFRGNLTADKYIFKPVASAYRKITPEIVDTSVTNFFQNLGDIGNAVNNLLQFKVGDAVKDTERFVFNSTFGIGGLFDIATEMGLEKHHEDFGQTLAVWGVDSGPYIMLPFFGPTTLRDATAKFSVDSLLKPTNYSAKKLEFLAVEKIDKRADLFSTEEAFKNFSSDQYSAVRDAWLQRREYLIRDGKVDEDAQSDLIDELEDLDDE